MPLTRKQFLNIAGPGALGAVAHSVLGSSSRAEAEPRDGGGASSEVLERPYSFKATATAFGGQIEKPFPDVLEVQGATALPPSGGRGSAHVENYRYGQIEDGRYVQIVSIGAAHSEVFGGRRTINRGGKDVTQFETFATVTMTDVRIGDREKNRISVARILGRLTSVVELGSDETPLRHQESRIEGLEINGQDVELSLHDGLFACDDWDSLMKQAYSGFRPPVLNHKGEPLKAPDGWKGGSRPYPDVMLTTSVFKEPPAVKKPLVALPGGCRIKVGEWTLTLGQLEITPHSRRLTMLRVDMVPNQAGTIVMAAVEGNGRTP